MSLRPGSVVRVKFMWPFGKKANSSPVEPITQAGLTAHYDVKLKYWTFQCDGIEFHVSQTPFNLAAFDWAREAATVIRLLDGQIRARVLECLEDWPCDKEKSEILSVDLDEYPVSKTLDISFVGDESWGDFGVTVIITDGSIVDVCGGD